MKHLKFFLVFVIFQSLFFSCSKGKIEPIASSLTLINAVVGSNSLVTNFSNSYKLNNYYKNARKVYYGSFSSDNQFGGYNGPVHLMLYQYPDTTDHSTPLFNLTLNLPAQSINTLFLTGKINAPDTLFTTDHPPYHATPDSSFGVRFINLSPGASPISVNINGSQISRLSYKEITAFKKYPATSAIDHYTFEIRDAATGDFISDYSMNGINNGASGVNIDPNEYRYRNFTIALIGEPGSQQILFIKNF